MGSINAPSGCTALASARAHRLCIFACNQNPVSSSSTPFPPRYPTTATLFLPLSLVFTPSRVSFASPETGYRFPSPLRSLRPPPRSPVAMHLFLALPKGSSPPSARHPFYSPPLICVFHPPPTLAPLSFSRPLFLSCPRLPLVLATLLLSVPFRTFTLVQNPTLP